MIFNSGESSSFEVSFDEDTFPVLITNTSFNIEMFSGRAFNIASELEL